MQWCRVTMTKIYVAMIIKSFAQHKHTHTHTHTHTNRSPHPFSAKRNTNKNNLPAFIILLQLTRYLVDSSWNVMAHGDAREGKWRGNWGMEWIASTLHTTSEHGVSSITSADAHTSAASSRLNWRPRRFKWTSPFRRKTKSGFCACAVTFQLASTSSPHEQSYEIYYTVSFEETGQCSRQGCSSRA